MVQNKLIAARKEKNMTQREMAELLFISQSQYQRRECGDIRITEGEWERIAKHLGKEIQDIKEEDNYTTFNDYDNNSGNYSTTNNFLINIPEFLMKNQQDYIEMLKEEIRQLKEENRLLKMPPQNNSLVDR